MGPRGLSLKLFVFSARLANCAKIGYRRASNLGQVTASTGEGLS